MMSTQKRRSFCLSRPPTAICWTPRTLKAEWKDIIAESGEGLGPYGAKGIGEPPCTAGAAAIACAVSQAIGARITRIPITPDHVLEVMGKLKR